MPGTALLDLGNVGDLSKPATVLLEKVSDAIGGLARPWQIKRIAQAEAVAKRMRAESEVEVSNLLSRAGNRFIAEQTRIQLNIEGITKRALPNLTEDSSPEDVEDDWIVNFLDKCKNISENDMQALWSRILAGEANNPGSFSRRTVNLVADLESSDAELFSKYCSYMWLSHADSELHPFIFDFGNDVYTRKNISYASALHLQSLGLITLGFDLLGTIGRHTGFTLNLPEKSRLSYFGRDVDLHLRDGRLHIGNVLFTQAGKDLSTVCGPVAFDEFFDYIHDKWVSESLIAPLTED